MKIKIKQKLPTSRPSPPQATNLAEKGLALALADLADERGMHVAAVLEFPHFLAEAGLPAAEAIPHWVKSLAHKINRNTVDGMLFRCNWRPLSEAPPEKTLTEARQIIADQERAKQAEARESRRQSLLREDRRNQSMMTPEERAEARAPVVPVPLKKTQIDL